MLGRLMRSFGRGRGRMLRNYWAAEEHGMEWLLDMMLSIEYGK
jgi:hypothetical protein